MKREVIDETYQTARSLVLCLVEDRFGKNVYTEVGALKDACELVGLRIKVKKSLMIKSLQPQYQKLVDDLILSIKSVEMDESDGIEQEIAQVSAILVKFKKEVIEQRAKNIFGIL